MIRAAEKLEGFTLNGGWIVGPLLKRNPLSTGGNFSQSYRATNQTGRSAFIKAIDIEWAIGNGTDFTQTLQRVTSEFNFEVSMVNFCASRGMDRVVRAIESGYIRVDQSITGEVPYLIFEAADRDVRSHMDDPRYGAATAWKLRTLHNVATGLKQLHSAEVVHQDLKPSNVVVFDAASDQRVSKLADLGRSSRVDAFCPFDHMDWPGDPNYRPPEVCYSFFDPDWHKRRIAYDIYMLGSLISFLFLRVHANAALWSALDVKFWPQNWGDDFEAVLPYLQHAFGVTQNAFASYLDPALAGDLIPVYSHLCNPDPRKRGHPNQDLNKLALERFITKFDLMARKASVGRYGTL